MIGAIGLTWVVFGIQVGMWLHPQQPAQSYTKTQLDAATKPLKDQIEQLAKENQLLRQGNADALAKATAALRAQIAQLLSDKPISVDKLPTSLRVVFNSNATYTQIAENNIAAWEPISLWNEQPLLLGRAPPIPAFVIVFKKPVAFDDIQVIGRDSGITGKATTTDPQFAVVAFMPPVFTGIVDIIVQNKHGK